MSEFKLISKYLPGLSVKHHEYDFFNFKYVQASDLERELGKGTHMNVCQQASREDSYLAKSWKPHDHGSYKHSGLLIGIQPIEKEQSAEDLLREVVRYHTDFEVMKEAIDRARKFLERNKPITKD